MSFRIEGIASISSTAAMISSARAGEIRRFLADAAGQKFDIIPKLGPEMASFIDNVYATPPPLLKRAIDMLASGPR